MYFQFLYDVSGRKVREAFESGKIQLPPSLLGSGATPSKAPFPFFHHLLRLPLYLAKLVIALHAAWFVIIGVFCLAYCVAPPSVSTFMLYREINYSWAISPPLYVSLANIPESAQAMLVRIEDYHFYQHHGVDFGALKDAWYVNQENNRISVGGSTIPMQLARTLFLTLDRNYLRKYLEILVAFEMDFILGKDRELELYFNCAEWGKGLFGIEAAARKYYKRSVTKLSRNELRVLIALLASPIKYDPTSMWNSYSLATRYNFLGSNVNLKSLKVFNGDY